MNKILTLLVVPVILIASVILFQNCGKGLSAVESQDLGSTGAGGEDPGNNSSVSITFSPNVEVLQGQNVAIQYQLNRVSESPIAISVRVAGGNAVADTDYAVPEATFTIPVNMLNGVYLFATRSYAARATPSSLQLEFTSNAAAIAANTQTNIIMAPALSPNYLRDIRLPAAVKDMFSSYLHHCAILIDNRIYCWGFSLESQLGQGVSVPPSGPPSPPVPMGEVPGALYGTAGHYHNCVLNAAGEVYCWGAAFFARGENGGAFLTAPTRLILPARALQVASGGYDTCVLLEGGSIVCWGNSFFGPNSTTPQTYAIAAKKIAMSAFTLCYIDATDGVRCVALTDLYNGVAPTAVSGLVVAATDIKIWGIGNASRFGCAKNANNQWSCWPNTLMAGAPIIPNMTDVFTTAWYSSVCASSPTALKCWGLNDRAQLGNGMTAVANIPLNQAVDSLYATGTLKYTTSAYMGCAQTVSGVKCSGY